MFKLLSSIHKEELNALKKGTIVEREHKETYVKLYNFIKKYNKLPHPDVFYSWIAGDHLKEFDNYYEALEEMEDKLNEEKINVK